MALNPEAASFTPSVTSVSIRPPINNNSEEGDDDISKKRKRNNKIVTPKQVLMRDVGQACKKNDPEKGLQAYREAKEDATLVIPPEIYNMLIALLSGMSNHIRDSEVSEEHCDAAFELYEDSKVLGVNLQEAAYTSLLRICRHRGQTDLALKLLNELKNPAGIIGGGKTLRLRTYLPLLNLYVDQNDCDGAFGIYESILEDQLVVGEREYVLLLKVVTAAQDSVRGEHVLKALAEDCLRPSKLNTWPVLIDWFCSPASHQHGGDGWRVVKSGEPMSVDEITGTWGKCLNEENDGTGYPKDETKKENCLLSIDLSNDQKRGMMDAVGKIAIENNKRDKEEATKKWAAFTRWLSKVGKKSFDVIIDGANVGYYKQNYAGAPKHVSFEQIDWILRHFQRMGHKPLIILHQRHLFTQNLPKRFVEITERWRDERVLYSTPSGANDDWYWMYGALWLNLEEEVEEINPSISSTPMNDAATKSDDRNNAGGGGGGGGDGGDGLVQCPHKLNESIHFVSNDEMRDHYFSIPSKTVTVAEVQSFMRWKERHQCHFDFGYFNKATQSKEVLIFSPTPFSIRMQCATTETIKFNRSLKASSSSDALESNCVAKEQEGNDDVDVTSENGAMVAAGEAIVAWHVPCWKDDQTALGFVGHEYSHADEFANLSKPADPANFEWISFIRESYFR